MDGEIKESTAQLRRLGGLKFDGVEQWDAANEPEPEAERMIAWEDLDEKSQAKVEEVLGQIEAQVPEANRGMAYPMIVKQFRSMLGTAPEEDREAMLYSIQELERRAADAMPAGAPCKPGEVSPACPMRANNDVMADDPNCKPGVVSPACPVRANNDVVADDSEYADDEEAVYNPRDDALENDWRAAAKRQHQKDRAQRAKERAALKRQKAEAREARELARHPELAPPVKRLSQAAVDSEEAAEAAKAAAAEVVARQAKRAAEAGRHSSTYNRKECDMECRQAERRTLKEAERAEAIAEKEKQRSYDDDAKREASAASSAAKAEKEKARAQAKEAKEMAAALRDDMKEHRRLGTKHFPKREGFAGQPAQPVWPLQ